MKKEAHISGITKGFNPDGRTAFCFHQAPFPAATRFARPFFISSQSDKTYRERGGWSSASCRRGSVSSNSPITSCGKIKRRRVSSSNGCLSSNPTTCSRHPDVSGRVVWGKTRRASHRPLQRRRIGPLCPASGMQNDNAPRAISRHGRRCSEDWNCARNRP